MKKTGVFYHELCGREAYSSLAMGVQEGFDGIRQAGLFSLPNIRHYLSREATEPEIARLHSQKWIDEVRTTRWWQVSLYSVGGMLLATEKVMQGEVDNALLIAGVGGHHAHRDSAWGGCYFNVISLGIPHARALYGLRRFAIVDTDTHHADGVRDLFQRDNDVLHICLCSGGDWDESPGDHLQNQSKICLPHGGSDAEELRIVAREVPPRIRDFKPEAIYWLCGMDTHVGSYGTQALSEKCYPKLAKIIKPLADEVCGGRLIVKTCCNAPPYATSYAMPRIVDILAESGRFSAEE
jgi:acetoin utilization deacetylase AcuC-like enzyme